MPILYRCEDVSKVVLISNSVGCLKYYSVKCQVSQKQSLVSNESTCFVCNK